MKSVLGIILLQLLSIQLANAQWVNRYPKLDDFGHQIYLEQHELPAYGYGISDPGESPDGKQLAISSKGWIWLVDTQTLVATRITKSQAMDSRPRWSPNGQYLAFVRDYGADTAVVIKNLKTNEEEIINNEAIDIDPEFSHDGKFLIYASGQSGSLDLYRWDIKAKYNQQVTQLRQVERNPRWLANGEGFVYLHGSSLRSLRIRSLLSGEDKIINQQSLSYHVTNDTHPTQNLLVFSAPIDNDYHLWTMDIDKPEVQKRLTSGKQFALTPSFSGDGEHIYYVTLSEDRQFTLMKIPTYGGEAKQINITQWEYGTDTQTLTVNTQSDDGKAVVARVSIRDENGHGVTNPYGPTFIDSQSGRSYFYLDKRATFKLPIGNYTIEAVRGPMTPIVSDNITLTKRSSQSIKLTLKELWDPGEAGYASADFHVHLNGDGHHRASHEDALLQMQGENLNILSPQSWNRWERKIDAQIVGKRSQSEQFEVVQGQEVRSHFHGHVGLIKVDKPFYPWFFGPTNPVLGDPNLSNGQVFEFAKQTGAFATYVHPISTDNDPFSKENIGSIPLELVSDSVIEAKVGLEIVCAWTSPLGTSQMWYRLLNVGKPVVGMSGTDTWIDFHRTPAVGTGRAFIRPLGQDDPIITGALAGRSVLSTGPMLLFAMADGAQPGDTTSGGIQAFGLSLTSTNPLEMVQIIVNGKVVQELDSLTKAGTKTYKGSVDLPEGGWVAARAFAKTQRIDSWPSMHVRPFAHTSPIWINEVGSIDGSSYKAASQDLLRAIDTAETRAKIAYGSRPMPKLFKRFEQARNILLTEP